MRAHELARVLLAGPDGPVYFDYEGGRTHLLVVEVREQQGYDRFNTAEVVVVLAAEWG